MMDDHSVGTFKSFIWSKQDVIGAGATSYVYKALCQNTGDYYAVKVFNDQAKQRANQIQTRELELLHIINHENVVKLIDKDEQKSEHRYSLKLIVMEYCNGGSLATLIEEPENIYGLQQSEFILVLNHITKGMNELHKLNIVHRDIKPNNILLQILPTGEHVYKLSDFGAARQVEMEDAQFTSICGTEEYLFPDVYERALINRNIQKSFKAGIDLWSTGVTLYHVATGMLPYRPIGGRSNRETMIRITRDKPSGCISGIQNPLDGQIEYSNRLPDTCQLSKNLQELLVPMLAGLMENNYDSMWSFEKFFEYSTNISNLVFVNVMNLDTCQIIEFPFDKTQKLSDLKEKIQKETKIDVSSQLIIYNNLIIDLLVTENQCIETYPLMDKHHPCILFSLSTSLSCDNLEIIRTIPNLRCVERPQKTQEILYWSKETSGSIYYIKREIYLITMIIELLKLSAIAFKSYMPEMKLKNQNLMFNFKSSIKSLEIKLNLIEKLDASLSNKSQSPQLTTSYADIKKDIKKYQDEIFIYESEINCLTNRINEIDNFEFLIQNSSLTSRWKKEADAYTNTAQRIHEEFLQRKKELRYKSDLERFEKSKFTEFKIKNLEKTKEEASKLYQEVIIVHFYDFYLKFEKWMSDLIKLHNDISCVQMKLVECEKQIYVPLDQLDQQLDERLNFIIETQVNKSTATANGTNATPVKVEKLNGSAPYSPSTPSNTLSSSFNMTTSGGESINSTESRNNSLENSSVSSRMSRQNLDSLITGLREFKVQASEIEKALDENAALLKFLHDQFRNQNEITNQTRHPTHHHHNSNHLLPPVKNQNSQSQNTLIVESTDK